MPAVGSPAGEENGARLKEAWPKCTGQQYKCKLGPLGTSPTVVCGFSPGLDSEGGDCSVAFWSLLGLTATLTADHCA